MARSRPIAARLGLALGVALLLVPIVLAHGDEHTCIAELLGLEPDMQVADVGAGDGQWGEAMARLVGESGHVYVTEVDDGELIQLRRLVERRKLANVSVVEGKADDTMLPEACCDAILLRQVYHHMSRRDPMRDSLRRSLRPGGRLLVIEKIERSGHGITIDELIAEMTADGFMVVSRHPEWGGHANHYAVVFVPAVDVI